MKSVWIILPLLCSFDVTISLKTCRHEGLTYDSTNAVPMVCSPTPLQRIHGDFNGDGRTDWFCHDTSGATNELYSLATKSGVFYDIKDANTKGWCVSPQGTLLTGDVNGDGRDDLICRYSDGMKFQVSYFIGNRFGSPMTLRVYLNCPMTNTFLVGDINGDHADDFVCADMSSGKIRIHYNGQHHRFRRHSNYHYHGHEDEIHVCTGTNKLLALGDINGDRKADLVCHDPSTAKVDVAIAESHGHFRKTKTYDGTQVCPNGTPATLFSVQDINGDGNGDLACVDVASMEHIFFYNPLVDGFVIQSAGPVPYALSGPPSDIAYGDFNGDGMADVTIGNNPLEVKFATCSQ